MIAAQQDHSANVTAYRGADEWGTSMYSSCHCGGSSGPLDGDVSTPNPWTPLRKPPAECWFALLSGAGFVLPGQARFDASIRGWDVSFREIPSELDATDLLDPHRSASFDHDRLRCDPSFASPIDRVREMVESSRVGTVADVHLVFMGSITAPGRLVRDTTPAAARRVMAERVDVAVVAIQLLHFVADRARPPRVSCAPFRHGYPLDTPYETVRQHAVLEAALRLLQSRERKPPLLVDCEPTRP